MYLVVPAASARAVTVNFVVAGLCVGLLPRLPQDASVLNSILSLALVLGSTAWIVTILARARDIYQEFDLGGLIAFAVLMSACGTFFTAVLTL